MVQSLYTDPYISITFDASSGLVRYIRSPTPFASIEEARDVHTRVIGVLPASSPARFKLLLDLRHATPRNDEAFEQAILKIMAAFLPRFTAHAFLVRTAAGRLQTRRLASGGASGVRPGIFDAEADALTHLGIR